MSEADDAGRSRPQPDPDSGSAAAEPVAPAPPLVPPAPFASVPAPDLARPSSDGATPSLNAAGPVHARGALDATAPSRRTTQLMILGGVLGLLVLLAVAVVLALRA